MTNQERFEPGILYLHQKMSACVKFITCGFWSDLAKYVFNSCTFDSECSECCKIHFVTTEIPVEGDDDESTEVEISNCCLFRHKE